MLTYLKVRNLAIVEELAIDPGRGLNVLTGETGAGKSLLIDSLEFLSGARGSTEMVRTGAGKLTAEAVMHVPASIGGQLEDLGISVDATGEEIELIVRREIASSGRGRVLVNGSPLSVRELGTAMELLIEIHGQSESHARLAGQSYQELVDAYARHGELTESVRRAFNEWKITAGQLQELQDAQRDRTLRLDLLRYQIDEISTARVDPAEETSLQAERTRLAHAREMIAATAGAFALLDEDDDSAIAQTGRATHLLQPLARQITELGDLAAELQEITFRLQEAARTLARLAESTRHDPRRLEEIEDRIVTLERLKKKYGGSIDGVLEHLSRIQDEHQRLTDYTTSLERLQKAEAARFEEYRAVAERLSAARRKTAADLERAIERELHDLAMERTTLRIIIGAAHSTGSRLVIDDEPVAFNADGYDRVEILIAPNRGDEPRPLQRVASGGELSRVQLAVAAALFNASDRTSAATLVFDEIDAGIGGRVAEVVGRKLSELAARNQVICVTHLPQIAAFGTTHFHVWKEDDNGQTRASVRKLVDDEQRVAEIARMLGGEHVPASAIAHARELLDAARAAPAGESRKHPRR